MALPFKKDLEKYKEIDEDDILNKLSEEELKQLESALDEIDPEVRHRHLSSHFQMSRGNCNLMNVFVYVCII